MKIDRTDIAIIEAFQADGRQSNREVARRLGISEGAVRQRLKKLISGAAVRFDVVTDPSQTGTDFVAFARFAVAPAHLERFLGVCAGLRDIWYLAVITGRFNVQALVCAESAAAANRLINAELRSLDGVTEFQVRQVIDQVKHDFYEVVIPRTD